MTKRPRGWLPEHWDNPFVRSLGPPPRAEQIDEALTRTPIHRAAERRYPPHMRRYCVLRLMDDGFITPQMRQIEFVERIHMAVRLGYRQRDPARGLYKAAILDAVDRSEAGDYERPGRRVRSSAIGLTVIGQPGLGKSLAGDLGLDMLPAVAHPDVDAVVVQVPWLKLECPTSATRRQFCVEFFAQLDARLGQGRRYRDTYGYPKANADTMLLDVQQLCQVHAVGILVVDEVQNLADSVEGPEKMMKFLTALVNVVGVPVCLIGTMKANAVIGRDFRQARRAVGLHHGSWERFREGDPDWRDLVRQLWDYQWTADETPLTDELRATLYAETQGIPDVLVKLFVMCQFRAILVGEVGGGPEVISPALVRRIAQDHMGPVRPMIEALREGRLNQLERWPDLKSFHAHVSDVLAGLGAPVERVREARSLARAVADQEAAAPDDAFAAVRAFLTTAGHAPDVVSEAIRRAREVEPAADSFTILPVIRRILEDETASRGEFRPGAGQPSVPPSRPGRPSRRMSAPGLVEAAPLPDDDLRSIVACGRDAGQEAYAALLGAGVIAPAASLLGS